MIEVVTGSGFSGRSIASAERLVPGFPSQKSIQQEFVFFVCMDQQEKKQRGWKGTG